MPGSQGGDGKADTFVLAGSGRVMSFGVDGLLCRRNEELDLKRKDVAALSIVVALFFSRFPCMQSHTRGKQRLPAAVAMNTSASSTSLTALVRRRAASTPPRIEFPAFVPKSES